MNRFEDIVVNDTDEVKTTSTKDYDADALRRKDEIEAQKHKNTLRLHKSLFWVFVVSVILFLFMVFFVLPISEMELENEGFWEVARDYSQGLVTVAITLVTILSTKALEILYKHLKEVRNEKDHPNYKK